MKTTEYAQMAAQEDSYWWHLGRLHIIRKQLNTLVLPPSAKILNIGSGTGGTIPLLQKYGSVINVETSDDAIEYCRQKGFDNIVKPDGIKLPFNNNSFDLVVAFDVLEHINLDELALVEWYRVLKPSGIVFITVPAYQWLWSEHDESLHHYRRYIASSIHRLLNNAGFKVLKRSYAIAFSFPLIIIYRLFRGLLPSASHRQSSTSYVYLPPMLNNFFVSLLRIEASLLKYISLPFGTSVLALAKKSKRKHLPEK